MTHQAIEALREQVKKLCWDMGTVRSILEELRLPTRDQQEQALMLRQWEQRLAVISSDLSSLSACKERDEAKAWQPIETAPKDGTRVLLGSPREWCDVGHWESTDGTFVSPDAYGPGPNASEATHWRPLPSAPVAKAGEAQGSTADTLSDERKDKARNDLQQLTTLREALKEYGQHSKGCQITRCERCGEGESWHGTEYWVFGIHISDYCPNGFKAKPCTCGFSALLSDGGQ